MVTYFVDISLTNRSSTFVMGNFVQSWSKIPHSIIPVPSSSNWNLFLICMHRENRKFKQSVLTLVSPVSSRGIRDNNNIYITPTMILYEDIKPIEHVLLHPISVLSHLMCPCKHCNIKLSFHYWTHWSCWWIYHLKIDLTQFFIIKPRHPGRLNQADLDGKTAVGAWSHGQKRLLG